MHDDALLKLGKFCPNSLPRRFRPIAVRNFKIPMFLVNEEEDDGNVVMENGKRGSRCPRKFWSVVEDSHLISSWLTTSKSGKGHHWHKAAAFVNENHTIKDGPRNWKSCKNRWSTIAKYVSKFVDSMVQARERATAEMSESDVLILANQLYRDDVKSDFLLSHAYQLLHNEPKFLAYMSKKKPDIIKSVDNQDICEIQPNIDDELSFSEAEASSKRSRLNEGGDYLSANNVDDDSCTPQVQTRSLDPCTPQVPTRTLDPCTPQVQTRSLGVEGQDNREGEVEPMQSVGSLEEHIQSSLQVFRETNQKVDVWKEVKLRELQVNVELSVKKMEQKNRDSRYKLFNTLLGKASLSEFDEALKNKLYAELFPE